MTHMKKTDPMNPLAPWLGGKRNLAKRIVARIDKVPHKIYAEPFVGMGGVFLRRTSRPSVEAINDRADEVSNLFRVVQRHAPLIIEHLHYQLASRTDFNRLVETPPKSLTDVERAARFLYLQRTAFGGKVSGKNFGVSKDRAARFDADQVAETIEAMADRLRGVWIECLDYSDFIRRYDSSTTLFYLDPPYWGCEGDYGKHLFERADFEKLADQLAGIKGRFILSLNAVEGVRETFKRFDFEEVETTYTVGGGSAAKKVREVLISN